MTRTFLPNSNGIGQQPTAEKVASYGLKVAEGADWLRIG